MSIWWFIACFNQTISYKEIVISGSVSIPEDDLEAVGSVQLRAYREWTGDDSLRNPLLEIDKLKIDALGPYEWTLRVDRNQHEGLAIYGWLDRDNDGVLCHLYGEREPAGLLVLNWTSIDHFAQVDILFDQECAAAESLYGDENFFFVEAEDSGDLEN